jgi:hypothetical protein
MDRHLSKGTSCGAIHATTATGLGAYEIGRSVAANGRKLVCEGGRRPFVPFRQS